MTWRHWVEMVAAVSMAMVPAGWAQQQPAITATGNNLQLRASDVLMTTLNGQQSTSLSLMAAQIQAAQTATQVQLQVTAAVQQAVSPLSGQLPSVVASVATANSIAVNNSAAVQALQFRQGVLSAAIPAAGMVSALSTTVAQLAAMTGPLYNRSTTRDPAVRPQGCKDLNLTAAQAGVYNVWPLGPNGRPTRVFCTALVDPLSQVPGLYADWTVIAADVNGTYPTDFSTLYGVMPTPTSNGAQRTYMQADLRSVGTQLFVSNEAGQSHIFKLANFNGPVQIDGPNWVGTDDHSGHGIVAGNNHPVVYHFQVGQACTTTSCYVTASCQNTPCNNNPNGDRCCYDVQQRYSSPVFALFDWDFADARPNAVLHASFGGTNLTRGLWSYKGTMMAIR